MEPNKFEEYIKSKLEDREIQPSPEAWERIAAGMGSGSDGKGSGHWRWGLAASIAAVLVLALYLWPTEGERPIATETQVVEVPVRSQDVPARPGGAPSLEQEGQALEQQGKRDNAIAVAPVKEGASHVGDTVGKRDAIEEALVLEGAIGAPNALPLPQRPQEALIMEKIDQVAAQVALLERNGAVTDAEVDSLLRLAQMEILSNRALGPERSVDAMALLTEVEEELDRSYRDQIFESLKSGFLKMRTAVADRQ
ncbi:hypothetical protein [Maribacter sp. 2307ULW6-5]|uniref:hypothetical protein n=1 Tax=Maribacter sp. 2307ULW6-5 TaxID=3386275 RepID=UPI0039BD2DCE